VKCPRDIKVTEVMYAFKRRALEEGLYPKRYPIPVLAQEFRRMARTRGRVSEAPLVAKVVLQTNATRVFGMRRLGLGLLRTGRFSLRRERIERPGELARYLRAVEKETKA
jgi:hypothetical protein